MKKWENFIKLSPNLKKNIYIKKHSSNNDIFYILIKKFTHLLLNTINLYFKNCIIYTQYNIPQESIFKEELYILKNIAKDKE